MREMENKIVRLTEIDGIIYLRIKIKTITLEIAQRIVEDRINFTVNNGDFSLYADGTLVKDIDKKAREYFGLETSTQNIKAIAVYSNSIFSSFMGNFMIQVILKKINFSSQIIYQ